MSEIFLIKRHGVLMPASESDVEKLATLTEGETIRADFKRPRNIAFHRKYFALLDVLYNIFEPAPIEHNGEVAQKSRERFRKDIAIATGHYELVINIKGECRAEAKSISFASMDDMQFAELYSRTINYGLQKIAIGKTREQIDNWVDQIIDFS